MFTFYLFSFIPVVGFSLFLWTDIYKKRTFDKRPTYLLLSLIIFGCIGLVLMLKEFGIYDELFSFTNFTLVCILYLVSFFLLEYSVHCQRIVRSFLMGDFKAKLRSLYVLIIILSVICFAAFIVYHNRDELVDVIERGIFKGKSVFSLINGVLVFVFVLIFFIANINIKNNIFNLQSGVIRREDVLFNSLAAMVVVSLLIFWFFNGLGMRPPIIFLGLSIKGFQFEILFVLNLIYAIRLYTEYFFRRLYNDEKTIRKQRESVELKNYLINLVLTSPLEEDINIIKSTIKDSLERSMRNLVVTEYRITGTFILRRNGNILRVDSQELVNGFCVPLILLGGTNMKKKSSPQLNDMILKKSYDLNKLEHSSIDQLTDWGEKLIKQVMTTGKEYVVKRIPKDFLGMQRFIGIYPVISHERLDGLIVVFKESFEELFPEERNVIADLQEDLKIIFSITQGKRVQSEKNRLQGEIDAARTLQTSMVPAKINMKGYDCACYMETASEVGGDAYDCISTPGGTYLGIGDVSGHGLPAGLAALIQQAAFQAAVVTGELTGRRLEPYEVYNIVNKVLCEINTKRIGSDKFMTQNYLLEKEGNFTHAGAHEIALLYFDKEEKVIELEDFSKKTAFMGFSPLIDAKTSAGSFRMEQDDILLMYSDGIIEAKDHYSHQYGVEHLKHLLLQNSSLEAEALVNKIVADVKRHAESGDMKLHGGKLADDITLMVLKKKKVVPAAG